PDPRRQGAGGRHHARRASRALRAPVRGQGPIRRRRPGPREGRGVSLGGFGMRCPRGQFENPVGAKYCLDCGARQSTVACRACGTELPASARFCLQCGQPVATRAAVREPALAVSPGAVPAAAPPAPEPGSRLAGLESYTPRHLAERILVSRTALEGERKLVTVLFCDLTGSTALAERL